MISVYNDGMTKPLRLLNDGEVGRTCSVRTPRQVLPDCGSGAPIFRGSSCQYRAVPDLYAADRARLSRPKRPATGGGKVKHPKRQPAAPSPSLGTIRRDEVLPFGEVCRRMGWADQMAADVQRMGLPTVIIGRRKYTTGVAVFEFVEGLMQVAAGDHAEEGAGRQRPGRRQRGGRRMILAKDGNLSELAAGYLAGGLSLVPTSAQTKRPDPELLPRDEAAKPGWKVYQERPADAATVKSWFARGCKSVAAIGGRVSGGLLIIDFDDARFYPAWREQVGSLADGLPVQRTGREGGGYQVWLRCPEPGHNDKLAYIPDENEESGRRVAIETRAEGGYAVMPGSLHPSGNTYRAIAGDFAKHPHRTASRGGSALGRGPQAGRGPAYPAADGSREKAAAKTCNKYRAEATAKGA